MLVALGLFGAALLYGDGMITPAISVLGAVEGLEVATHIFEPYIVPRHGGDSVRPLPDSVARDRARRRSVRAGDDRLVRHDCRARRCDGSCETCTCSTAFNPLHAVRFFGDNGWHGFVVLGSVFLVVTGGEALYADMGHFGQKPIRLAWFALVLPALLLNYLGQGAMLLTDPSTAAQPFYLMAPRWALYPLVALATMAAIIASQALISGAFSLTRQAIQLGYCPRLDIEYTSASIRGRSTFRR